MYKYLPTINEQRRVYLKAIEDNTNAISIYNESTGEFRLYRNYDTGAYPTAGKLPKDEESAVEWNAGEQLYVSMRSNLSTSNVCIVWYGKALMLSDKINNELLKITKEKVENTIEYSNVSDNELLSSDTNYEPGYIYSNSISQLNSYIYYAIQINSDGYFWLNSSSADYNSIDSVVIRNESNSNLNRMYRNRDYTHIPNSEEAKDAIIGGSIIYLNTLNTNVDGLNNIIYFQTIHKKYYLNDNISLTEQMRSEINDMDLNNTTNAVTETIIEPQLLNDQPTVEVLDGYYYNSSYGMTELSQYTSWIYQFDHDIQVYAPDELAADENTPYLSICVCYSDGYMDIANKKYWYRNRNSSRLPTSDDPLTVLAGEYLVISRQSHSFNSQIYYLDSSAYKTQLLPEINLSQSHINQIKQQLSLSVYKSNKIKYENNGTGILHIAQAQPYGYVVWDFHHFYSESTNANGWRIYMVYLYDDTMSSMYNLSTGGEWECALHLAADKTNNKNRIDFSGMGAHGDEVYTDIKFLIDGAWYSEENLNQLSDWTKFKNITVYENSKLYDPGTGESSNTLTQMEAGELTEIADHYKRYIFEGTKCTIYQKIEWLINDTTSSCYLAMFPIAKTVSSYIIDNTNLIQKDLNVGYYNSTTAKSITMINNSDNICVKGTFSILNYDCGGTQYGSFSSTDNGGGAYNKCYYHCKVGDVTVGEVWNSITEYEWSIGIPHDSE